MVQDREASGAQSFIARVTLAVDGVMMLQRDIDGEVWPLKGLST
jgi:hypothetical protein